MSRRVQFYETDEAGVVHFSNFFRYFEEAEHAMWRSSGLTIAPREGDVAWPRVAASFEYQQPLRFEDEFEVFIRVEAVLAKTIRYACRIECAGARVATGSMTIACVRKRAGEPMRSIAIPDAIRARFVVSDTRA